MQHFKYKNQELWRNQ